jgi:hypothetical protein
MLPIFRIATAWRWCRAPTSGAPAAPSRIKCIAVWGCSARPVRAIIQGRLYLYIYTRFGRKTALIGRCSWKGVLEAQPNPQVCLEH